MDLRGLPTIRLHHHIDTWPVSINVAMPTGLVVNEFLIVALKHGFPDGEGGTSRLHSLVDDKGRQVIVADDGVGLPDGVEWPQRASSAPLSSVAGTERQGQTG